MSTTLMTGPFLVSYNFPFEISLSNEDLEV